MKNNIIQYNADNHIAADASKLGLDFECVGLPVFKDVSSLGLGGLPMEQCKENKAICRTSDGFEYGVVGKAFEIFQPRAFISAVLNTMEGFKTGEWISRQIGGKIFVDVALTEYKLPVKVGDEIQYFARFATALDGSMATITEIFAQRLICLNGMVRLVKKFHRKAKHSKNSHEKIMFNLVDLATMIEQIPAVQEKLVKLAQVVVDGQMKDEIIARIFPSTAKEGKELPKQLVTRRAEVLRLTNRGKGNDGTTLWDVWNGLTEYTTHHANTRETTQNTGEANRFISGNLGANSNLTSRAFDIIGSYVN